jgi:hypothetical protein
MFQTMGSRWSDITADTAMSCGGKGRKNSGYHPLSHRIQHLIKGMPEKLGQA